MTTKTDETSYRNKMTLLKREQVYRPLLPILDELRNRIDELEADLETHKQPRPRGRPKKLKVKKDNVVNI